jgi:hypothetical protein
MPLAINFQKLLRPKDPDSQRTGLPTFRKASRKYAVATGLSLHVRYLQCFGTGIPSDPLPGLSCRQRKLKCDKQVPCGNCQRFQRDCLYIAPALDTAAQQKLAEIKDRLGDLEETLERDVARRAAARPGSDRSSIVPKIEAEEDDLDGLSADDEQDPEPSPLGMFDQVYDNDADDGLMDLGIQLGKLRMSDRVGGLGM